VLDRRRVSLAELRFHLAWLRGKRVTSTNEILFSGKPPRLVRSPDHVERQRTYPFRDFTDQIEPADHSSSTLTSR
jgi:hypothetical protein